MQLIVYSVVVSFIKLTLYDYIKTLGTIQSKIIIIVNS